MMGKKMILLIFSICFFKSPGDRFNKDLFADCKYSIEQRRLSGRNRKL
jgi:hypothetical protein